MYTATLKEKTIERNARRIKVVVTVTDGTSLFDETFYFSFNTEVDAMKKVVKSYLDELNGVEDTVTNLTDLTPAEEPVEPEKTADELAKEAWDADWSKLQAVQPYIDAGVFDGTETPIKNLRDRIKAGFKPEYLEL